MMGLMWTEDSRLQIYYMAARDALWEPPADNNRWYQNNFISSQGSITSCKKSVDFIVKYIYIHAAVKGNNSV